MEAGIPNDELFEAALEAIKELFNDTSVSQEEAATNLETLKSEIETLISTLKV